MSSLEKLTTLSNEISKNTKILTDYLSSKGLEAPSFDVDGLDEFPISPEDEEPFKARLALIAATKELYDISLGPKESLRYLAWDAANNLSLQAVYEFKIAENVPLSGSISYQELAEKVNVPLLKLRPLIRHAMTNHIFQEPVKGYVGHTRTSRLLVEDKPLHAWVAFYCEDLWVSMTNVVKSMKKWPGSQEPNQTGVNLAFGTDLPWFDFLQSDEALAKRYNLAMQSVGGGEGFAMHHVVEGYPWAGLPDGATIVDMGGNQGYISFAIAEKFTKLNFIVQDTAGMRTTETIGAVPENLKDRVTLTTHDFFTPQTVVADVYFFRWIFHGFSEKYCIEILQALAPALKKGARIVINDGTLPEPNTVTYLEEKTMRTMDIMMQVTVNAREREVDDWKELFQAADQRYKFLKAWKPEKSRMWLIEAEWDPEAGAQVE
ncbi:S-adenosyl-L-methionine-dependent methyltransferase [Venustampulla echinocandica]|uniref:S-adenosyl-L-methionine-dependent methyltransferase n=1 Tax=Venustampulla echinocandica TaxID=2656787 RepID=A0A370TXC1_9HELO|nr:S-adenosyl-L-methionine-dependent methyltransferase [Venustampulla echinocandica]RDL40163.1 S-adenosyl-L-methionine-dependent methyltransferase [Venustampulla echinocandica]